MEAVRPVVTKPGTLFIACFQSQVFDVLDELHHTGHATDRLCDARLAVSRPKMRAYRMKAAAKITPA